MSAPVPTPTDLRTVVDAVMAGFAEVPDDGWSRPAEGLTWDCRDTAAHLVDDLAAYALNLSSREVHLDGYIPLLDPPQWQPTTPPNLVWPDPAKGTAAIVRCVDAAGGLLVAVTTTAPRGTSATTLRAAPTPPGSRPWGSSRRPRTPGTC